MKETFKIYVQRIDEEYQLRDRKLFRRACVFWGAFVNRMRQVNSPWTASELAHLAEYRFVPIDRNVANGRKSYRDNNISPIDEFAITTMKEIIAPQYLQIA